MSSILTAPTMLRSIEERAKHALRSFSEAGPRPTHNTSYAWQASQLIKKRYLSGVNGMHYVYLLRSQKYSEKTYIGMTCDIEKRLISHNEGANKHTTKFRPWNMVCYIAFEERSRAAEFEQYLKHGSGHAFAKKHLW